MKTFIKILLIHGFALLLSNLSFAHVRTITPKIDDIVEIKTSLAFATLIHFVDVTNVQFPIIGDQSAFRIEPAEYGKMKGLSLKPLRYGAKTNLYLFTDNRRFNFKLVTGPENSADYIVYVKTKEEKPTLKWQSLEKSVSSESLKLTLHKVTIIQDQVALFDLNISTTGDDITIAPENVWIHQGTSSLVIENLFLSSTRVSAKKQVQMGLAVYRKEIAKAVPIQFLVKTKNTNLSLKVSAEVLWK